MDNNDDVSEKADQAIKCAKKLLTPSAKTKNRHNLWASYSAKNLQPLDQRKRKHYYSGRAWEKAEMMKQFYKAKTFIGKEADEKMVQENVALFKP